MSTNLGNILNEAQIIPEMRATTRWEAIDELVDNLVVTGRLKSDDRSAITAVVRKRESSMSTGIGYGVGIPHAATDLIPSPAAAFGRSQNGIEFAALDGQPVKLVILLLIPHGQFQKHLHIVAEIARAMHVGETRERLLQAPDACSMLQIIRAVLPPAKP